MLRWAIVGTSFISHTMARAIGDSPGSVATVVCGRDETRRAQFAAQHAIANTCTSVAEAVARDDVDAVYIGSPNHVHHDMTVLAAASGKAVLSEKSLTVTMDQADELLAAVTGKVLFVEGLMYLAHPVMARLVDVLRDGRLGTLKAIHASYAADIWQLVNPAGGGAIYNLGCYPASLVQLVVDTMDGDGAFGEHTMTATGNVSEVDGNVGEASVLMRFASGATATVHTAETYGNVTRFDVQGSCGRLSFVSNPWLPALVVVDPMDAFDHQVRLMERLVAEGSLEAERPSPRLRDSYDLMSMLTQWESLARA
jgi:dihydrodiol dehydrogenase / D-xylose 1-dehydrogenase (NADP)